jgi:hexulose-6-phosphate isomerase
MNIPVNRRDAIRLGAAAVAASLLTSKSRADQTEKPPEAKARRTIKKALMWDMVKGGTSVLDRFKIIKDTGFDGVQMNSGTWTSVTSWPTDIRNSGFASLAVAS